MIYIFIMKNYKPRKQKSKDKPQNRPQGKGKATQTKPAAPPRPKSGKANLWGTHAVTEAFLNPARHIRALYVTDQALRDFDEVLKAASQKGLKRPAPAIIDKNELDRMLPQGAVHQGLALDAAELEENTVQDFIITAKSKEKSVLLMLDQVTDPHNVGAILRSACAFGADGVIMQRKHAPELMGVLAKTACGAVEYIPVAYETNLTRTLEALQEEGFFAVGLDERGEQTIAEAPLPDHCVLVLGAEGPGIRRLVKEQCDMLVRLPMSGAMPSINVSNAAAVSLYALIYGEKS